VEDVVGTPFFFWDSRLLQSVAAWSGMNVQLIVRGGQFCSFVGQLIDGFLFDRARPAWPLVATVHWL